jgi:riboflavin kinase/FMN adenylyltransferase
MVVRPDIDVRYLTTLEEKLTLTRTYGAVDDSIVIHFTPAVAAMSAQDFMDTLCSDFNIKALVVGANFSLGHDRKGNVAFLEEYGQQHGIEVRAMPLAEIDQNRVSSTRIRSLVGEGRIAEANELLGHPVTLSEVVRRGDQRGRLIGFPTANLVPDEHKLLPADGVYAVQVHIDDPTTSDENQHTTVYKGAANIGIRPTFNGKEHRVEVYLLDVQPDLYDKRITIDFIARLRGEQRFSGIEALKAQIAEDVQQVRQIMNITDVK